MLVTQYVTPKAYDRVFITIGRISRLVGYAAMFASLSLLINQTSKRTYQSISYTIYAISLLGSVLTALAPRLPSWVVGSIFLGYIILALIYASQL